MLNTSWDDDGESLFEMTWYGIVLGAAASWQHEAVNQKQFDADFDWSFFRNEGNEFVGVIHALGSVNAVLGPGTSDDAFWREPFTTNFQNAARANAEKIRQMRFKLRLHKKHCFKTDNERSETAPWFRRCFSPRDDSTTLGVVPRLLKN